MLWESARNTFIPIRQLADGINSESANWRTERGKVLNKLWSYLITR